MWTSESAHKKVVAQLYLSLVQTKKLRFHLGMAMYYTASMILWSLVIRSLGKEQSQTQYHLLYCIAGLYGTKIPWLLEGRLFLEREREREWVISIIITIPTFWTFFCSLHFVNGTNLSISLLQSMQWSARICDALPCISIIREGTCTFLQLWSQWCTNRWTIIVWHGIVWSYYSVRFMFNAISFQSSQDGPFKCSTKLNPCS